jgi:hypothetical protein
VITGSCPYEDCDGPLFIPCAEKCPAYERHTCETCNRVIWTMHSRWQPCSWTEAGFLEEFTVDDVTKKVEPKNPPREPTPEEEKAMEGMFNLMTDVMIHGVGFKILDFPAKCTCSVFWDVGNWTGRMIAPDCAAHVGDYIKFRDEHPILSRLIYGKR